MPSRIPNPLFWLPALGVGAAMFAALWRARRKTASKTARILMSSAVAASGAIGLFLLLHHALAQGWAALWSDSALLLLSSLWATAVLAAPSAPQTAAPPEPPPPPPPFSPPPFGLLLCLALLLLWAGLYWITGLAPEGAASPALDTRLFISALAALVIGFSALLIYLFSQMPLLILLALLLGLHL